MDSTLPLEAKLSKSLQTKQLDLSMISSLLDEVLHTLEDAITPAADRVLELLDSKGDHQQATGEIFSADKIHTFQETVGTLLVVLLKENISAGLQLMILCQHWPYLIPVKFSVPILPNFPLMK